MVKAGCRRMGRASYGATVIGGARVVANPLPWLMRIVSLAVLVGAEKISQRSITTVSYGSPSHSKGALRRGEPIVRVKGYW